MQLLVVLRQAQSFLKGSADIVVLEKSPEVARAIIEHHCVMGQRQDWICGKKQQCWYYKPFIDNFYEGKKMLLHILAIVKCRLGSIFYPVSRTSNLWVWFSSILKFYGLGGLLLFLFCFQTKKVKLNEQNGASWGWRIWKIHSLLFMFSFIVTRHKVATIAFFLLKEEGLSEQVLLSC